MARLTQKIPALRRPGVDGAALGSSIGTIASMVIWLLGLIIILGIFEHSQVLSPVISMLEQGLGVVPNIIGAVFVFCLTIAKIVRALITTALNAVDFGKLLGTAQSGFDRATGGVTSAGRPDAQTQAAPQGQTAQAGAASPSSPASRVPEILAAVVLVGIGVLVARFVSGLFRPILESSGIDAWLTKQEILPQGSSATPTVLRVVEIAVVLFFAVMGAQALGFPQITAILSEILELGGNVLFGGAIIAAGFFLAMIVGKVLKGTVGTIVKWAVIILFVAMGLKSMGVADSIIEMAFGALVIGAAAAAMLAFGLGGREAAARQLAKLEKAQAQQPATGPGPVPPRPEG
ncbi:mechanosensitive ion channel [Brachybacterium sp.]|uniref:mechanosensitive ion channel n=1 Tax=Brachybacterium sp. TaxID=1891286 RepID=UPI002ED2C322